jgi:2-phosphoglycerate kinase
MSNSISTFNKYWEKGVVKKPLVVLLGGYAGTGKSTIAALITKKVKHINTFPTGLIRAALREYISQEENPYLFTQTYNLHLLTNDVVSAYITQCSPISNSINQAIDFANIEKQSIIFDGNHVLPGIMNPNNYNNVLEVYLKVSDPKKHLEMLGGPTHNREFDAKQFDTARKLHEFIVNTAYKHNKPVFEYDEASKSIEVLLQNLLGNIVAENKLLYDLNLQ